jgi:hypothetical protein
MIGEAHAEAVRLHPLVAGSVLARPARFDARQEAARRVARNHVRIDAAGQLMVHREARLHTVERFAVRGSRLAADRVADTGSGHQVALVGRVDEHPAVEGPARLGADRHDPARLFVDAADHLAGAAPRAVEPLAEHHRHVVLADETLHDGERRRRLERPHRRLAVLGP